MGDLRVGDITECRRCGGLMLVAFVREDLCGRCGRELARNMGGGETGEQTGRRHDGRRRARDGATSAG